MEKTTPVYLFTGFLDAGKTSFIQETMEDPGFGTEERTLIVLCEEGENEYEPEKFAVGSKNVSFVTVEKESDITEEFLGSLNKNGDYDRALVEYNGMWQLQTFYDAMPESWEIYQIICLMDSTTFDSYYANMRQLMIDKLMDPEMVIFNRCSDATDRVSLHRTVRSVNRSAQMAFERSDGSVDEDVTDEDLPYDIHSDHIELSDEDFAIWYLDSTDHPEKYEGKTIHFKGYVCQSPRVPKGCFVAGRFAMVCCMNDLQFMGVACESPDAAKFPHRSWVTVDAKISVADHEIYGGPGPWLKVISAKSAEAPEDEIVYLGR